MKVKSMVARVFFWVLALQIVSLVSARSGLFSRNDDVGVLNHDQQGNHPESLQALKDKKFDVHLGSNQVHEEAYSRGLSRIGSIPPNCEHKCFGCTPCEAIQVPTITTTKTHFGPNYANYEPEGWKCKCGHSFFSP